MINELKEMKDFVIGFIVLIIILIVAIMISNKQDKDHYEKMVVECGGTDKVVEKYNSVDQISYYVCKK